MYLLIAVKELSPPNFKKSLLHYILDEIPRGWEDFLCPTFSIQEIFVTNGSILKHRRIKPIPSNR